MKVRNIMFDVTDNCNFRCNHCYKNFDEISIDLNCEKILYFINKLDEFNDCAHNIIISGGEPLLYPDLFNLLEALNGKNNIRINTNGLFLDRYIDSFQKIKNLKIQISLDGYNDETYFSVRNNHYFDKIVQNATKAQSHGLQVYFRATLTSKTIENYENFFSLSKSLNIPLFIRPMVNTGEIRQKPLMIDYPKLRMWCDEIVRKKYESWTGGRNILAENACPLQNGTFSILTIDNHGNVYPCSLLRGKPFYMGNIITDSFEDISYNSKYILNNVLQILNSTSCQKCGFRKELGDGTCIASCYFGNKSCVGHKIKGDYCE